MARVHVFAVARRVRGPPGRPEDPVRAGLRPSAGSVSFIVCRNLRAAMGCRGNGRWGARTAAWTRKATRDCFWDLAESFLRWKKRGTSGRRSAHGARIGRGNDWKDLSVHSSPLALEKNRASTSSCVAEQAPGGTRDDAPGDRSAGSEGRGGTGEGGHDCLLGGYRNVRCRVLKTSAPSAMLGLLLPRQTARSAVETL